MCKSKRKCYHIASNGIKDEVMCLKGRGMTRFARCSVGRLFPRSNRGDSFSEGPLL